jgi:peptidoglycan/LPS O-acetylase OafA/YrhL
MALGSAVLVAGVMHLPAIREFFSTPLARFYGRISYSLYLVHLTVLLVPISALRLGEGQIPLWLALPVFAAVLAVSTALAALGYRFVEAPAIAAGRALIRGGEALARGVRA